MLGDAGLGSSLTSARVGVGNSIIDCRSWEATITGLPSWRQRVTTSFCTDGTSSRGIWAPASHNLRISYLLQRIWPHAPFSPPGFPIHRSTLFSNPPRNQYALLQTASGLPNPLEVVNLGSNCTHLRRQRDNLLLNRGVIDCHVLLAASHRNGRGERQCAQMHYNNNNGCRKSCDPKFEPCKSFL